MSTVEEPARVRALLDRLDLPGVVDVHTHFMPQNVLDKVWAFFDRVGPALGRDWPITYRFDEETRLGRLRALGVETFTSLNYPHRPGMAQWLNEWSTQFAQRTPDCLHSGTFFPEPDAARYVPAALDAGVRVFKVHVQVGAFDPNDALLDPVWGALQDAGTPVVIHCGDGPNKGEFTGVDGARRLLRRFPRLVLVIAHLGMPQYSEFLDLAEAHDGVHLDTTMSFTDFTEALMPFPADELPRLRDLGHKVLLGSDYPNIPYPYAHQLETIVGLGLDDDWNRAVLRENAVRLFGLA